MDIAGGGIVSLPADGPSGDAVAADGAPVRNPGASATAPLVPRG